MGKNISDILLVILKKKSNSKSLPRINGILKIELTRHNIFFVTLTAIMLIEYHYKTFERKKCKTK